MTSKGKYFGQKQSPLGGGINSENPKNGEEISLYYCFAMKKRKEIEKQMGKNTNPYSDALFATKMHLEPKLGKIFRMVAKIFTLDDLTSSSSFACQLSQQMRASSNLGRQKLILSNKHCNFQFWIFSIMLGMLFACQATFHYHLLPFV